MEPFFTTKGPGKGTGLGLSMVHGLAAQAGGAVRISSRLGAGTAVTLWLPRARPEDVRQEVAPQTPPAEVAGRSLRVLVVDDDVLVSMNAADMLMDLGHSVVEAGSGAQALQVLESDDRFDAMLTDYAMPGMNGLDLATKIRRTKPDLPIVLATGYADLAPHATTLSFPRLAKPYTQQELAKVLEAAVGAAGSEELVGSRGLGQSQPVEPGREGNILSRS
jgi:CheY-like chemotaxis protein